MTSIKTTTTTMSAKTEDDNAENDPTFPEYEELPDLWPNQWPNARSAATSSTIVANDGRQKFRLMGRRPHIPLGDFCDGDTININHAEVHNLVLGYLPHVRSKYGNSPMAGIVFFTGICQPVGPPFYCCFLDKLNLKKGESRKVLALFWDTSQHAWLESAMITICVWWIFAPRTDLVPQSMLRSRFA